VNPQNTWSFFMDHRDEILGATLDHLTLVIIAMIIAILIGLPLGMFIVQRPALRAVALGIASIFQTIPSLALFGFLIPIPFIMLEVIVGLVQALVFSMLTMVFMTILMTPHHAEAEEVSHA